MVTNVLNPTMQASAAGGAVSSAGPVEGAPPDASIFTGTGPIDGTPPGGGLDVGVAPGPSPIIGTGSDSPGPGVILPPLQGPFQPGPGSILPPSQSVQGADGVKIEIVPDTLKATVSSSPIPGRPSPTLNVTVDANVAVFWDVELVPATPQGINPQIKLLAFNVCIPGGLHPGAMIRKTFSYAESPAQAEYTQVTLDNAGDDVTVTVNVLRLPAPPPDM
jgi:hypothetical protein